VDIEQVLSEVKANNEMLSTVLTRQQEEISKHGVTSTKTAAELAVLGQKYDQFQKDLHEERAKRISLEAELGRVSLGGARQEHKSLTQILAEHEGFKGAFSGEGVQANFRLKVGHGLLFPERKTITSGSIGNLPSYLYSPTTIPGIITEPQRTLHVRDLFAIVPDNSGTVNFVQENVFTNNAAVVPESGTKPASTITYLPKQEAQKTIAHYVKTTRQALRFIPTLQNTLEGRLSYGLRLKEDNELLYGDGTDDALKGLKFLAGKQTYAWSDGASGDTKLDAIRRAITLATIAEYPVTGVVLNPTDWEDIELTKDSNERYIWVSVTEGGQPRVWKVPVVESNAISAGECSLGAWSMGAELHVNDDVTIDITNSDGDDFTKNIVTIRAEEVLCPVYIRPKAFVWVTFDHAPTS
jgi:HK97 family phage major capsid protein